MSDAHQLPSSFPVNYEASSGFDHPAVLVDQAGEKAPLISTAVRTKVYFKRWYILVVFSLGAAIQGGVWNTWGPISSASEDAFGWTDSTIALLSNWGPISYVIATFPLSWLIDVKGIRWATLCMSFLVALGTGLRCITSIPTTATWLIHIGQFLNGVAGPVAMGGPPVVSAEWFPPHQRTTATAVSIVISSMGVAASFLLGPYLVPDRKNMNQTHSNCSSSQSYFTKESSYLSDSKPLETRHMGTTPNSQSTYLADTIPPFYGVHGIFWLVLDPQQMDFIFEVARLDFYMYRNSLTDLENPCMP